MIKYLPDLNLQTAVDCYFWLLASIAVIGAFASPARSLVRPAAGAPP